MMEIYISTIGIVCVLQLQPVSYRKDSLYSLPTAETTVCRIQDAEFDKIIVGSALISFSNLKYK